MRGSLSMLFIYHTKEDNFDYENIPPGYYFEVLQNGRGAQQFWHKFKFLEVVDSIPDGSEVLDIGCGPGSFLYTLAQMRPRCRGVGVDIADPQINFANEKVASQFENQRISFKRIQEGRLPFEDAQFDIVSMIELIEHIHPHKALNILLEARRVLKPEGRILVTTPNYRSLWPFIEMALEYLSPIKYDEQHINKFTPNSFVKFIETAGFRVLNLKGFFVLALFWPA